MPGDNQIDQRHDAKLGERVARLEAMVREQGREIGELKEELKDADRKTESGFKRLSDRDYIFLGMIVTALGAFVVFLLEIFGRMIGALGRILERLG